MTTKSKHNDIENPKPKDEMSSEDTTHHDGDVRGGERVFKATPSMKRAETGDTENSDEDGDNNKVSGNTNKKIPSVQALIYDFNGSIGFIVGSSGFIFSLYRRDNWLPYFRYGCCVWIWACIAYAIPILSKPAHDVTGQKYSCGEAGVLLCLFLFIAGCSE
jgi:hypothetical protein